MPTAPPPESCVHCGSCTAVCPVYRATGRESLTARGKLHLLATELAAAPSPVFQDLFAQCLLCGGCERACPRGLPIRAQVVAARARFPALTGRHGLRKAAARYALARPALLEGLVRAGIFVRDLALLPADSGLRLKLGLLSLEREKEAGKEDLPLPDRAAGNTAPLSYFAGCLARYLQPEVGRATGRLVRRLAGASLQQPPAQGCCGLAAWSAGALPEARRLAQRNILAFGGSDAPILTSCASCAAHLVRYPELFADDRQWREKAEQFSARIREFTSFVLTGLEPVKLAAPVERQLYYQQPCHLRDDPAWAGAALQILRRVAGVRLVEPDGGALCCGQGGLFHLGYPELAAQIFAAAHAASSDAGVDLVVTSCTGCLLQWQAGLARHRRPVRAEHLAIFLAGCLDINS